MIKVKIVNSVNPDYAADAIETLLNQGYSIQEFQVTSGEYAKFTALLTKDESGF